jgi:prepilin-type N-terminal cleavage/methylation domain-containing protein
MKRRLNQLIHKSSGFTMIETLVAVAITGIIIAGLTSGIFQITGLSQSEKNELIVIRDLDTAGNWFVRDFVPATSIPASVTLTPGHNMLSITQSVETTGNTVVIYTIDSNQELLRTSGSVSTLVAIKISEVEYTLGWPATVQIISTSGQKVLTKTYQLVSQLNPAIPLTITNNSAPQGDRTVNYSFNLASVGGTEPYSWSIISGSLPGGLSLNSSKGAVSGTPTTAGTSNFTIQLTDSAGATTSKAFSILIYNPLTINTTSLPSGETGANYMQTLIGVGGTTHYDWEVTSGSLPAGLTLDELSGTISGGPTTSGLSSFTIRLIDSAGGSAFQSLSISIIAGPSITTSLLPNGVPHSAYSQIMTVSGGTSPYSWSISSGYLPGGLTLNTSSGAISGTPTTAGTFNFTVTVSDSLGITDTDALCITIGSFPVNITTGSFSMGKVGVGYNQTLGATGGVTPYTWSLASGSLPNGLTLNSSSGIISGSPTVCSTFNFTIRVVDNASQTNTRSFSITISGSLVKVPSASIFGGGFTNPGFVYAQDGSYATTSSSSFQTYGGFGFSVPSGSTINGIAVTIVGHCSGKDAYIAPALSWNNGGNFTSSRSTTTFNNSTDLTLTSGDSTDTWGRTWSAAEIGDLNFVAKFTASGSMNGGHALQINYLYITVFYTPP